MSTRIVLSLAVTLFALPAPRAAAKAPRNPYAQLVDAQLSATSRPQDALRLAADAADALRAAGDAAGLRSAELTLRRLLATIGGEPVGAGMADGRFVAVGRRWAAVAPERQDAPVHLVPVGPDAAARTERDEAPLAVQVPPMVAQRWLAGGAAAGAWLVDLDDEAAQVHPIPLSGRATWATAAGHGLVVAVVGSGDSATLWVASEARRVPIATGGALSSRQIDAVPERTLAVGDRDGSLRVWRLDGPDLPGEPSARYELGAPIDRVRLSPDGGAALVTTEGDTPGVWQVQLVPPGGRPEALPAELRGMFGARAVAPSGSTRPAVVIDEDTTVAAARPGATEAVLLRGPQWGRATPAPWPAALLWDGGAVAVVADRGAREPLCPTCSTAEHIELWTVGAIEGRARGEGTLPAILEGHEGPVLALASQDWTKWLISGSADHTARIWTLDEAPVSSVTLVGHQAPVVDVASLPTLAIALTLGADGVRQWPVAAPTAGASPWSARGPGPVTRIALPGRGRLATVTAARLSIMDLHGLGPATRPLLATDALPGLAVPDADAWLTGDGRAAVVRTAETHAQLWDLGANTPAPWSLELPGQPPLAVSASADGRWLAAVSAEEVALWDRRGPAGAPPTVLAQPGDLSPSPRLRFDPTGRWLAIVGHNLLLWDLSGLPASRPVDAEEIYGGSLTDVAFTADGKQLLGQLSSGHRMTGTPGVALIDLSSPLPAEDPPLLYRTSYDPAQTRVTAFAVSPDGRWALWATDDEAKLLDLRKVDLAAVTKAWTGRDRGADPPKVTGLRVLSLTAPRGPITAAAFDAASARLVTGDRAHGVWSWDLRAPDPSATPVPLGSHPDDVASVVIGEDGRLAATTDTAGGQRLWLLRLDDVLSTARAVASPR